MTCAVTHSIILMLLFAECKASMLLTVQCVNVEKEEVLLRASAALESVAHLIDLISI